jgi:hypothetical protein
MKVTKWSTFTGELNVSEQKVEQTSGEPGSLSAGQAVPNSSEAQSQPAAASEQPAIGADAPKADAPRTPGKVMIISSGDRAWDGKGAGPKMEFEANQGMFGKRRLSALAAVVALATVAGALGGALVTSGLGHFLGIDATSAANGALEASVARIDADILALKASVEHTSKLGMSQFNNTSDRLDRVEQAQAEPAARLAKLSEAVDKLRAAPAVAAAAVAAAPVATAPVAAAPVAAKEVTGSIAPPEAPAPAAAPKAEVARLPNLEGWVLRDVAYGGALIESRRGVYEVYAGDAVPGLGRVDAIRKQDGRWVVVTSKGLIVARR